VCRRGVNPRTTKYTEEFNWEEIYSGSVEDITSLFDLVESGTKAYKKKKDTAKAEADFDTEENDNSQEDVPKTPKKRKTSTTSTPRKNKTPSKLITPSHKRYKLDFLGVF